MTDETPSEGSYEEVICKKCLTNHSFLRKYATLLSEKAVSCSKNGETGVMACTEDGRIHANGQCLPACSSQNGDNPITPSSLTADTSSQNGEVIVCASSQNGASPVAPSSLTPHDEQVNGDGVTAHPSCKLLSLSSDEDPVNAALFLPSEWRMSLCRCKQCKVSLNPNDFFTFVQTYIKLYV